MPNLFVIFAAQEKSAVILRRGPSPWYHLIQWDTRRDYFKSGAWFKGRIYEEKCDLSPDGSLFLYFVLKGSRFGGEYPPAWTAVSRTPWLHALALWPQGTTWGGGGRFIDNRTIALNGVHRKELEQFQASGLKIVSGDQISLRASTNDVPNADWCGRDQRDRIIFSRGGQLFCREKNADRLLADFTDLEPQPEPAPDWATRPL